MSVLIRGMDEMPDDGAMLIVKHDDDGKVYIKYAGMMGYSMELTKLPEGHGRLIDADAVIEKLAKAIPYIIGDDVTNAYVEGLGRAKIEIEDSVAVIEAEGEE